MGNFLLWASWAYEYIAIFVKIYGHHTSGHFKRGFYRFFYGHVFLYSDKTLTWPPMKFSTVVCPQIGLCFGRCC